uniref:Uncharacterized protein n=1 Tax=Tetraselmis sp. GSL018 TaxID=582737 RepID=A0A061QN79_9CHLO
MVDSSWHRIEIVTAFWARITDRSRNFSDVMRYLRVNEANVLGKRLGYYSILDVNRPSMHYQLRMYLKSEYTVAKKLFHMAIQKVLQTTSTHTYMKNLHVDGKPKHVLEGPNMWQVLTGNAPDGTDPQTTLEFDFDYPDTKAQTYASNLIKRRWQTHQRSKEYNLLRDQLWRRRGGLAAYQSKFPEPSEKQKHEVLSCEDRLWT